MSKKKKKKVKLKFKTTDGSLDLHFKKKELEVGEKKYDYDDLEVLNEITYKKKGPEHSVEMNDGKEYVFKAGKKKKNLVKFVQARVDECADSSDEEELPMATKDGVSVTFDENHIHVGGKKYEYGDIENMKSLKAPLGKKGFGIGMEGGDNLVIFANEEKGKEFVEMIQKKGEEESSSDSSSDEEE